MSLDFCRSIQVVGSVTESVFVDHVNTVHDHSRIQFPQDNVPCHKALIISQLPDLSQGDSLLDVVICILDMQQTIPQQLCDAIVSIWARICEQCFQNLVESLLQNA